MFNKMIIRMFLLLTVMFSSGHMVSAKVNTEMITREDIECVIETLGTEWKIDGESVAEDNISYILNNEENDKMISLASFADGYESQLTISVFEISYDDYSEGKIEKYFDMAEEIYHVPDNIDIFSDFKEASDDFSQKQWDLDYDEFTCTVRLMFDDTVLALSLYKGEKFNPFIGKAVMENYFDSNPVIEVKKLDSNMEESGIVHSELQDYEFFSERCSVSKENNKLVIVFGVPIVHILADNRIVGKEKFNYTIIFEYDTDDGKIKIIRQENNINK